MRGVDARRSWAVLCPYELIYNNSEFFFLDYFGGHAIQMFTRVPCANFSWCAVRCPRPRHAHTDGRTYSTLVDARRRPTGSSTAAGAAGLFPLHKLHVLLLTTLVEKCACHGHQSSLSLSVSLDGFHPCFEVHLHVEASHLARKFRARKVDRYDSGGGRLVAAARWAG